MKNVFSKSVLLLMVVFSSAFAQEQMESSCRIKAKEIAAETYRSCVSDQKNSQIEQIKKEYAAKLKALKAHYDAELKKLSGKGKVETEDATSEASPLSNENSAMSSEVESPAVVAQPEAIQVEDIKVEKAAEEAPAAAPMVKVQKSLPAKKATNKSAAKAVLPKKVVAAKETKVIKAEKQTLANKEMTLRLKPSPKSMIRDASGELPEPIPVETTQDSAI